MNGWTDNAPDLARWTMAHLVNRRDVWGQYLPWTDRNGHAHSNLTAPDKADRGRVFLSDEILRAHYCGLEGQIVGLHTTSADDTSRWLAFDFDAHDGNADAAAANWRDVRRLVDLLGAFGLSALLEDSNGAGGFHVWAILDAPAPTRNVFHFAKTCLQEIGAQAETFPKQATARSGYGNYIRLPGRHHKRAHWSRFYAGGRWHDGADAVAVLLSAALNRADLIPEAPEPVAPRVTWNPPAGGADLSGRDDRAVARECLRWIGAEHVDTYADWVAVGMALHDLGEDLLGDWEEWSRRSAKYREGDCAYKWRSFGRNTENPVTLGTLIHWARQAGAPIRTPQPPRRISTRVSMALSYVQGVA